MKFASRHSHRSRTTGFAFVEVLQNGQFLADTIKRLGKRQSITLGSSARSTITLPFYPLANIIELIKIDAKGGVSLNIDATWSGFLSCDGTLVNLKTSGRQDRSFYLRQGDYASLSWKDLRILIRLGPKHQAVSKSVALDPSYAGGLWRLLLGNREELAYLSVSMLGALIIFAGFVFGLLGRGDRRPTSLAELPNSYILPFVSPKHLDTLPEALQSKLERKQPLVSAIAFYQSLSGYLLGYDSGPRLIAMPTSVVLYKHLFRDRSLATEELQSSHVAKDSAIAKLQSAARVAVPTVIGESYQGGILRLEDKISLLHRSLDLSLKYRRETVHSFRNDPEYDFGEYKAPHKKGNDKIAAVKVWKLPTNEEAMYAATATLGRAAAASQAMIGKHRTGYSRLIPQNAAPVGIRDLGDLLSTAPHGLSTQSDKLLLLRASEFGKRVDAKVREPLIGEIDPSLIERAIKQRRFELQLCFELALRRNQALDGSMEWKWLLDSRGSISDLELVSSSINDRAMIRCVQSKISSWKFPRPRRGSVEILYPFHFTQSKG